MQHAMHCASYYRYLYRKSQTPEDFDKAWILYVNYWEASCTR